MISFSIKTNPIFLSVLFFLLLTPSLGVLSGFPSIRLEEVLSFSWLLLGFLTGKISFSYFIKTRIVYALLFLFLLPLSILSGVMGGFDGSLSDLNQFVRFLKYIAIYMLSLYYFNRYDEAGKKQALSFIMTLGVVLVFIAVSQYYNFFGMNKFYLEYVLDKESQGLLSGVGFRRPVGMVGNPNELGFLFSMLIIVSIYYAVRYSASGWFYSLVFFIGLALTLSRSSLASALIGSSLLLCAYLFKLSLGKKLVFITLLLFSSFIVANVAYHEYVYDKFTWRFESGVNFSDDNSFNARINNWEESLDILSEAPFFGAGPLRRVSFKHAVDNDWLLIARSYGVVGVFVFFLFVLAGVFRREDVFLKSFHVSLCLALFLYMIPASGFHSLVLFPTFLVFLAFIDSERRVSATKWTSSFGPRDRLARLYPKSLHASNGRCTPNIPSP